MLGISFIKILFPYFLYQNCVEPQGNDCQTNGWSISNRFVNCQGKLFIGPFGQGTTISKEIDCPPDTYLKFSFTSGIFDSWDHENQYIKVDGVLLDVSNYYAFDGQYMCLNPIWQDQIVEKAVTFVSKQGIGKVKISISDNLDNPLDDESWGIRDIRLQIGYPCVDFFSECNFQGDQWKICSGNNTTPTRKIPFQIKSIIIMSGIVVKLKDPKFMGGEVQTYTSNQTCILYSFPKYQKQD